MFKKILIANRGEIAVRILSTCREMGIRTVAVYSQADQQARHVREADEAYCIGPAPAIQSYLRIDTLIDVARRCGAEAIHPGYGFLSENPAFAEACEQARIVFIGPPASVMRLMGSKIAAKQLAQSVGAPTVPGYNGADQDDTILMAEAERIGFPLLIKASAGGGGKGMRTVYAATEFPEQLAASRREARTAFGDETVLLERLIQRPRHIEIQILADTHGACIHLGERECSIQRRHQKIVEESPSVALHPTLRAEMGAAAVRIARAAGYVNAGTLEFLLDENHHFYFLEMNARLQVEHPVTEMVTGLDLVRHQLSIASGEPLQIDQRQISHRGHAIEVRIYAENPEHNFLPSTGTVAHFIPPEGPGIRVDSGIASGDEITQYYDPMIAKLIVYGETRVAAISRLQQALERCAILGVTTNLPLLHAISTHPAFQTGQTHTGFLDEHGLLTQVTTKQIPDEVLMAAALYEIKQDIKQATISSSVHNHSSPTRISMTNPWQILGPWRMMSEARSLSYRSQQQNYKMLLKSTPEKRETWQVQINEQPMQTVSFLSSNDASILFEHAMQQFRVYIYAQKAEFQIMFYGRVYHLRRRQPPDIEATSHGRGGAHTQKALTAPMAGTIVKVQIQDGDMVQAHQVLVILSAMKMEHAITAPYKGKIQHVHYQEGAVVPGGAVLVEME